jgi:hypothetical protein
MVRVVLQSQEAKAWQRMEGVEKELEAFHWDSTEAAQVKREHDQLC